MKTLNEEEIIKLIKENKLDIKQLAAIAATIGQIEDTEIESKTTTSKSSKSTVSYELTMCSYPDLCITRTTPATIKQLVIMPSKNSYYITSLKGGDKAGVMKLDADLYADFTSGMEDIELPEDFWMNKVAKGKRVYENMMRYLTFGNDKAKTMIDMIKDRCSVQLNVENNYDSNYRDSYYAYIKNPILYKEFAGDEKIRKFCESQSDTVAHIQKLFGLNNARDYLNSLSISLVDTSKLGYSYRRYEYDREFPQSLLPDYDMNYAAFKEYSLYMAVRFGYGLSWETFFRIWNDTLEMEKQLFGKIREKYPNELPTYHNQLSYKVTLHKAEIDEANFARNSKEAAKYEWKMDADEGRFTFIAPTCPQDFYEEATQQANCLASYVQKFTDGQDLIMFMRDKLTPEVSEVTIEVVGNRVNQAYRANNAKVTEEEASALRLWAKKFKFEY